MTLFLLSAVKDTLLTRSDFRFQKKNPRFVYQKHRKLFVASRCTVMTVFLSLLQELRPRNWKKSKILKFTKEPL